MTQAATDQMTEIASKITSYAIDCYNYGWDLIVETTTLQSIIDELTALGIKSYSKALSHYREVVALYKEQRREHEVEIRAGAGETAPKEKRLAVAVVGDHIRLDELVDEDTGLEMGTIGKVINVTRKGQVEATFSGVKKTLIVGVDRFTVTKEA